MKSPTKRRITIRLSPEVVKRFRATGDGWQTRVDAALQGWLKSHKPGQSGLGRSKRCDRDVLLLGSRLPESLDPVQLMHRLCGEVRLAAGRTRPKRDVLNDQKIRALAEAAGHNLQLNLATAAVGTRALNRGRW